MINVKKMFTEILTNIQNIKQKLNKPMIVSQTIMTEAKDCGANNYCIIEGSYSTPSGYRAFTAQVIDTTNVRFLARACFFIANSKVRVYGFNSTSNAITNCQARIEVLFQLIEEGG